MVGLRKSPESIGIILFPFCQNKMKTNSNCPDTGTVLLLQKDFKVMLFTSSL